MGRKRRDGKHSLQKNNSMGNKENRYPVPKLNKTTINVLKSPVTPT
jgi:hypothetical protein